MGSAGARRGLNPWSMLLYTFGFAAALSAGLQPAATQAARCGGANPGELLWLGDAWAGWGMLLLLAAGPTLAGFGLYNVALSYLPSSLANLIVTLEPAFTAVLAYYLLDERLTAVQLAGGLLILGAVVLLRIHEGRLAGRPESGAPSTSFNGVKV